MKADTPPHRDGMEPARVMFAYLGRRGALVQFTLELARTARLDEHLAPTICISRQNENYSAFGEFGESVLGVNTFASTMGAVFQAWRIPLLRRQLVKRLHDDRIEAVIDLMPHVWSPLVFPAVRRAGVRYCPIIHDADGHPGDVTRLARSFADRVIRRADFVFTLSNVVAKRLSSRGLVASDRLHALFHPDFNYGKRSENALPVVGKPLRLLFLGRILPYKGLSLFLDTIDWLRREGQDVDVGVFGEGALGENAYRLEAMGAEVINRWLSDAEIATILPRFHAVVLSHIEASQSGVAAAAFGAGLPVIATPVGGLVEQIDDGITGMIAKQVEARALGEATMRLFSDPQRYRDICQNIAHLGQSRSMCRFVKEIVAHALAAAPPQMIQP